MMAVQWSWCVLALGLMACGGGDGATGAGVPIDEDGGEGDAATGTPDANPPHEDAGTDAGAPSDAGGDKPDALATQPAGNALSSVSWTEGDPGKLYPYAGAYAYADGHMEIEFSSAPFSEQFGRRIVFSCAFTNPQYTCSKAEIRNERWCSETVQTVTIAPAQALGRTTSPVTFSGKLSHIMFPGLGTLDAQLVNLPAKLAQKLCSDGTSG